MSRSKSSPVKKANLRPWPILRESWALISRQRSFWWLGLLAGLGQGYGLNPQLVGRFDKRFNINSWTGSLDNFSASFGGLLLILFLVVLAVWLLSLVAEAGLMKSIVKLASRQKISFRTGFIAGRLYLWPFVKVQLLLGAVAIVVALAIGLPALALLSRSSGLSLVTGGAGVILFILFGLLLALLIPWIFRFVILKDERTLPAIRAAWRLFRQRPWPLLSFGLVGLGVQLVASLVILATFLIILIPILLLAVLLFGGAALGGIFVLLLTVVLAAMAIFLLGGLSAWKNAYYTLAFQRIVGHVEKTVAHVEKTQA